MVAVDTPPEMRESTMPEESKFKALLSEKLNEADGRNIFTGTQVKDMLLDLWLALNEDVGYASPNPDDLASEPVSATDSDLFAGVQ